ncbi:MAG: winged helix-turn-helix transcriptional regulator [Solirubrobacteraceae bacterium]
MPYRAFAGQNCSIAATLAVVGERWSLLVMREALLGRRRFAEIREQIGVAPNILSDRLATLVEHGLLERRRYGRHPEACEYVPTRKGADITPTLVALMQWGDRYAAPAGPPRVWLHTACAHDAEPQLRCGQCGERLEPRELKVRPGPGATPAQRAEPLLPA